MKSFIYKFSIVLFALVIGSCSKELDLDPSASLDESIALNSDANVKTVLNSVYNDISSGNILGGNTMRDAELLGGDGELIWVGTFIEVGDIAAKQMVASNYSVQQTWLAYFKTINTANNVLNALSVVKEEDRDIVEGEAKFLRALTYFEAVRFYAKPYEANGANSHLGIPVITTPTKIIDANAKVSRNTVAEVYAQILKDLNDAIAKLPADNEWRASLGAANALKARVALQMGNYQDALNASNEVLNSGSYQLLTNYADVFGRDDNSSEDIFAIQVSSQDGVNNMNTFFSISDFGGRDGDIEITDEHLALYESNDTRLALFFDGNGAIRSGKWNNLYGNVGIIRLAEMYLIRAECNQRLGSATGATPLEDYNSIHTRAGLLEASSVSLDDILLERRRELAHEGFRIHDIKRLKQNVGSYTFDSNELVFPIPQREIEANENLKQNDGY